MSLGCFVSRLCTEWRQGGLRLSKVSDGKRGFLVCPPTCLFFTFVCDSTVHLDFCRVSPPRSQFEVGNGQGMECVFFRAVFLLSEMLIGGTGVNTS